MVERFDLVLFGGLRIERGGAPVSGFRSRRVPALLAYLAVTGRRQSRETLASLLWGELPEAAAQANLRNALANLKAVVGALVAIDRRSVTFDPAGVARLDVAAFEAHLRPLAGGAAPPLAALEAAADLYVGDLLAGFALPDAPAFDEWLAGQRARLRQMALEGLHALAEVRAAAGEPATAITALRRLLALEPWHEESHRQLMALLAQVGRRSEALAQYAACRRVLADELGVEPSAETATLYARIAQGDGAPPSAPGGGSPAPAVGSPPPPAPPVATDLLSTHAAFVGRAAELATIAERLADPACRLLTLTGPGGIGKTRLALQAAAQARASYADGVTVVALAALDNAASIAPTIADAIGLTLSGGADPAVQLVQALRPKRWLLVLDNLEHLLGGVDLLLAILAAAPGVTILATSRERLAVQAEWLLPVGGLALPADASAAALADSDAVRLFVARARQVRPEFTLDGEVAPSVARVCQLVDGLPLGIELAAAWARTHDPTAIAREIERSLDLLTTGLRDVPARHRSLRAVIGQSWARLDAAGQATLQALSVCRYGFTAAAAAAIAGATHAELAALIDRSLLHCPTPGRYGLHETTRQYAAEQLAALDPAAVQTVHDRHAAYYLAWLRDQGVALQGADQAGALRAITAEINNILAAWDWAVSRGQAELIAAACDGLGHFHELQAWLVEGEAAVGRAAASLAGPGDSPVPSERQELVGRLLGWQGRFGHFLGRPAQARALLERSLVLLRPLGTSAALALALTSLGRMEAWRGAMAEAARLDQEAVATGRAAGARYVVSLALNHLGGVTFDTGDYAAARRWWEEGVVECQALRDWQGLAHALSNIGEAALSQGDYAEARARTEASLAAHRARGTNWSIVHPWKNLALLATVEGQYGEARRQLEECVGILGTVIQPRVLAETRIMLARVALTVGDVVTAEAELAGGLVLAREGGYRRAEALGLAGVSRLALAAGDLAAAEAHWRASLAIAQAIGERHMTGEALGGLGQVAAALGERALARSRLTEAFVVLAAIGAAPAALEVALALAEGLAAGAAAGAAAGGAGAEEKSLIAALVLLSLVRRHPAGWRHARERAEGLHARLAATRPSAAALAEARGRGLALADVLAVVTASGEAVAPRRGRRLPRVGA